MKLAVYSSQTWGFDGRNFFVKTVNTRTTAMGCSATLRRGSFTSLGRGGFTSWSGGGFTPADGGGFTFSGSVGGGGGTSSGSAGGGGDTCSLPRFLDGSLDDAMLALEEEEALGFTSWWPKMVVLGFSWCRGWRSSWLVGIYIDKTANRQAAGHVPRNPCPLRRALCHKKSHVVTRRCVTVHILFKIPNAQLLLWVVRFLKKTMNCSYFY
jgi:hypothetical protein